VLNATKRNDDLVYQAKVSGLQKQAALERTAADKLLTDAQTAFSEQRALMKTQMDDRVEEIRIGMENGSITAANGMVKLTEILGDPAYGIDIKNTGLSIGGQLYQGLDKSFGPIFDLINRLQNELKAVGQLTGAVTTAAAATPGSATSPYDRIANLLDTGNSVANDIVDAVKALNIPAHTTTLTTAPLGLAAQKKPTPFEIFRMATR
jgi:hypothetical protein